MKRTYEQLFPTQERPHGWVQWKGTQACIDLLCACGVHGHLDEDFLYHVKCSVCGAVYALDGQIRLVKLNEEEIADLVHEVPTF